ncbi:sigma-70 family RNA polymerase sigma factor [Streptomyces sp. NPDC002851]
METDIHARWEHLWSHREQLLKVARRRSLSAEDAEDAVQEAMLRAVENPRLDLDDPRLGAWLTTVTMRLCIDRYRQVNREAEVRRIPRLVAPRPAPVDEVVCDRAEAKWLAFRSEELPARQAEALRLKAEDRDVGQVAQEMGLSYEAVESLLARARRTLRNSLAGTLGLVLWLCGRGRSTQTGGNVQAAAVASTAATLAVVGLVFPFVHEPDRSGQPPQGVTSEPVGPGVVSDQADPAEDDRTPAHSPAGGRMPAWQRAAPSGVLTMLPEVSVPDVDVPEVNVPEVAVPGVGVPDVPQVPRLPDASDVPGVPGTSGLSDGRVPAAPKPEAPTTTVPEAPGTPDAPVPDASGTSTRLPVNSPVSAP